MQQLEWEDGAAAQSAQPVSTNSALALRRSAYGLYTDAAPREQPGSENVANSLAGLVHDARNMVAAMDLYCDLLAEPEVLSAEWRHYAADLRLVSGAGRRLLDKLAATAAQTMYDPAVATAPESPLSTGSAQILHLASSLPAGPAQPRVAEYRKSQPYQPVRPAPTPLWPEGYHPAFPAAEADNTRVDRVCEELQRILPLVSAIAGPGVSIELMPCVQDWPLPLSSEDLTRVMANLVRNASEAMAGSGRIQIAVEETAGFVVLSVADEGPGIPRELMERVFQAGFSSRESHAQSAANGKAFEPAPSPAWPVRHRGLGLSIVRSIVSAARGTVWAANRSAAPATAELPAENLAAQDSHGAMFFLEFPLPRKGRPD